MLGLVVHMPVIPATVGKDCGPGQPKQEAGHYLQNKKSKKEDKGRKERGREVRKGERKKKKEKRIMFLIHPGGGKAKCLSKFRISIKKYICVCVCVCIYICIYIYIVTPPQGWRKRERERKERKKKEAN
jgi:hypothetical protein